MRPDTAWIATRALLTLCGLAAGVNSTYAADLVSSEQLLLRGPVDSVNTKTSQIEVLGQWVSSNGVEVEALQGHVVAVNGSIDPRGSYVVSTVSDLSATQYVPGSTIVHLTGPIQSINKAVGVLMIGGVSVDYTAALHSLAPDELAVGKIASLNGLRYTDVKKVYAADVAETESVSRSAGVIGSDSLNRLAGVIGSDRSRTAGVIGSDTAGVIGSDRARTAGVIGSDTAGVIGSDRARTAGVIGSDTAGVIGSDRARTAGVIGSDTAGVIGSDRSRTAGVIGSDTAGVIGSDRARTAGVIGSDTAGVIGSDRARTAGVIGSDTAGVIGSDRARTAGVIGSDTSRR